ncbi:MAG: hypothetical protein HY761_06645 [Candidatus Omnitrophica bacterium]|nr:hypothetical protein [Candidatus Omnitrophota bacterium]
MNKNEIWEFISSNFISLSTVISGVLIIILQQMGKMTQSDIATATLTIVILIATSELVDKSKKLDRLEAIITHGFDTTLKVTGSTVIKKYGNAEDGFNYMAKKIYSAKNSIDHVAFAQGVPRWSEQNKLYEKATIEVLEANHVNYRYIAGVRGEARGRLSKIIKFLENSKIKRFSAGIYYFGEDSFPGFSFMIFDNDEIVVYLPNLVGGIETGISIKNSDIVEQYTGYFARLWTTARLVDLEQAKKL